MCDSGESSLSLFQSLKERLALWWLNYRIRRWKRAYARRLYARARDEEWNRLEWSACLSMAEDGWDFSKESYGSIEDCLASDPVEEADEEMSNWDR